MQPIAIILVLLSAVMHALRNYLNKTASDKQVFVWWFEIFGLLFFLPVFIFVLLKHDTNTFVAWPYVLISGIIHFIYWYLMTKSLEKGDLSLVYPIMRSAPALVLIFSIIILNEDISFVGGMGILLVSLGVYTINMESLAFAELLRPLRAMKHNRATQFAFLTLISVAGYSLVDKLAVGRMHPLIFSFLYTGACFVLYSGYVFRVKDWGIIKKEWQLHKGSILICAVLSISGYSLILIAFTMERMSYIVGLRQLSIVFAVFLGGHLLKEKNIRIRIISSIVIFIGAYLIATVG